jgi:tetratricopeptide (TPR) repeat protein
MKWSGFVIIAGLIAAALTSDAIHAQSDQTAAVAEVRKTLDAARTEVESYKKAGRAAGAPDHPALKWDAALWTYRERYPRSEAAALASAEAVRLLVRAELWDRAHARIASVSFDDPAWARVATSIYEEGIARQDLPYTIDTLSRAAAATTNPEIKSPILVVLGRAYRRSGDNDAATRSLEAAKSAAPGTPYAEEAEGLLYEIKYLSIGLPAPPISGETRNGRAIDLAALRGKPVVLVFWGTT